MKLDFKGGEFVLLLFLALLSCHKNDEHNKIDIAAHRALCGKVPENSTLGIQRCLEYGVDMIEIDVRRTLDGVFVVLHDEELVRTTDSIGKVASMKYEALKDIRLKDQSSSFDQTIPTLSEVLQMVDGRAMIFLDKGANYFDDIKLLIEQNEAEKHCYVFIASDYNHFLREHDIGRIQLLPLVTKTLNTDLLQNLRQPRAVLLSYEDIDQAAVAQARALKSSGIKTYLSTTNPRYCGGLDDNFSVQDPYKGWLYLVDTLHLDGLVTNYPLILQGILK